MKSFDEVEWEPDDVVLIDLDEDDESDDVDNESSFFDDDVSKSAAQ